VDPQAAGTAGLVDPFHITVEGFIDSEFTDPPSVPEPSAFLLGGGALLSMLAGFAVRSKNLALKR
jgi:hypothetical protein